MPQPSLNAAYAHCKTISACLDQIAASFTVLPPEFVRALAAAGAGVAEVERQVAQAYGYRELQK